MCLLPWLVPLVLLLLGTRMPKIRRERKEKEMFLWWWCRPLIPFVSLDQLYVANVLSTRRE